MWVLGGKTSGQLGAAAWTGWRLAKGNNGRIAADDLMFLRRSPNCSHLYRERKGRCIPSRDSSVFQDVVIGSCGMERTYSSAVDELTLDEFDQSSWFCKSLQELTSIFMCGPALIDRRCTNYRKPDQLTQADADVIN